LPADIPSPTSRKARHTPPQVLLDVAAIQADRVLLLDTYFMVVVFYGATVAEWRRAKYHEQPEHQAFRSGMGPCLALCLSRCTISDMALPEPSHSESACCSCVPVHHSCKCLSRLICRLGVFGALVGAKCKAFGW